MSDEHDPIDSRIGDGFDRLRSDAQALDAMAPLRSAHGRRSRFPWGRIVLGGGLIAAVLLFVGMFALGGDDDPDEIVAGPGDRPRTATLRIDDDAQPHLTTEDLLGTMWILIEGVGPAGEIAIVSGFEPTFEIGPDGFSGNLSCNAYGYGGSFTPLDDRTADITVTGGFSQLAGCLTEGVMESEERFTAALNDVTLMELQDGLLVLSSSTAELIFRPGPPEFDRVELPLTDTVTDVGDRVPGSALLQPLTGTYWELAAEGPDNPMQTAWRPFRMEFPDDGRFFITGMCSWFRGEVGDGPRPFAEVDASPIADNCAAELQAIDATFVAILESVDDAFVDDEAMNGEPALFLTTVDRDLIFIPEVLDLDALTGVRWELDGWDLRADGSVRPAEAPAWFEMRPPVDPDDAQPTGTVRGSTGCIEFSGLWRLVDNQILFINEFDADACGGGIPDQDLQVTYAVDTSVVPRFVGGTVTMYATRDLQASVFRRGAPVDTTDEPLEGTTWELVAMPPFPAPSRGVTIQFDDARFNAQGPCNGFGGSYLLDGEELTTGDHNQSLEGCGDSAESDYFGILTDADRLVTNAGQLVISAGERDLVFEPSDG